MSSDFTWLIVCNLLELNIQNSWVVLGLGTKAMLFCTGPVAALPAFSSVHGPQPATPDSRVCPEAHLQPD